MARINAEFARDELMAHMVPLQFFCPLDLTSKNPQDLMHVAYILLQPGASQTKVVRLATWLNVTDILDNIKTRQMELDQVGVMAGDANDEKLRCAMTLRDCTVFVKTTPTDDPATWEAKMGDLDLKSGAKMDYWRSVEKPLIEEGWYEGKEKDEDKQPNFCHLNPDRFASVVYLSH